MNIHVTGLMLSNVTRITHTLKFHPHFPEAVILTNFYEIHEAKKQLCRLLKQELTHILVNVHVAWILIKTTRTTGTPAFWDTPSRPKTTHTQAKQDKVKVSNLKKNPNNSTRTIGPAERKRHAGRTDGRSETNIPTTTPPHPHPTPPAPQLRYS